MELFEFLLYNFLFLPSTADWEYDLVWLEHNVNGKKVLHLQH